MRVFSLFFAVLLLTACAEQEAPPHLVEVVTDKVVSEPYQPKSEYVGRLQARDDVAIQARVTGYLLTRDFREGDFVEAGTVLYTIDSSEYDAALARAVADLASALAGQANAQPGSDQRRNQPLLGDQPIQMTVFGPNRF